MCSKRHLDINSNISARKILKILKKEIKRLKHEMVIAKREIVGILKDRQDYLNQPYNKFTLQGYEIIRSFFNKDECERLIQVSNRYLRNHSYLISGNCYLQCRKEFRDVDKSVQQIMNVQEVDDKLLQLYSSHLIEEMFEQKIGEKLQLQSITIQVDNLDTNSKRGFHSDSVTPPVYKAFIYLNDVEDYGDGPYTVIPGSHRHTIRKIINYLYVWAIRVMFKKTTYKWNKNDRSIFYSDKQSISIFGKAGTLIISNQQLAHKGWHKHDRNKRYALICYLIAEKHYRVQPLQFLQTVSLQGKR